MFLCNTLSVWEDLDEGAVVLVEVAVLNRGDLTEQANKNISNSVYISLVASLCFSLLNAFAVLKNILKNSSYIAQMI